MNEYYGSNLASSDFFAHYGVKGMKWGVRKAIERGNSAALNRHFNRASRKLKKLTARTDIELIQKIKRNAARNAPVSAITGGLASGLGTFAINSHVPMPERAKYAAAIGGGMALANGLASGIENLEYRRMLSKKGYNKNVAKRKEFEKEMRKSFKGTKYGRQIDRVKSNINRDLNTMKYALSDPNERRNNSQHSNKQTIKNLSGKDRRDMDKALQNWANAFERHYQTGLSRGMTHEQAERYSNDYIAKNGFAPVRSSRRKRRSR